jgi:hypothetical protein
MAPEVVTRPGGATFAVLMKHVEPRTALGSRANPNCTNRRNPMDLAAEGNLPSPDGMAVANLATTERCPQSVPFR